jgi:hypothetical protein
LAFHYAKVVAVVVESCISTHHTRGCLVGVVGARPIERGIAGNNPEIGRVVVEYGVALHRTHREDVARNEASAVEGGVAKDCAEMGRELREDRLTYYGSVIKRLIREDGIAVYDSRRVQFPRSGEKRELRYINLYSQSALTGNGQKGDGGFGRAV